MEYFGFCAVNGMNKFDAITTQSPNAEMKKYLGCCHEIEFVKRNDEISYAGNEIDVAMFLSSGYTYETTKKNGIPCILNPEKEDIRLVKRFEFNRDMMMMTVIVEECASNEFTAICKGSYEKVAEKCKPESIPTDFEQRTSELAMQGYYVLGVAKKCFDGSDVVSTLQRSSVEKDFTFGGLLLFKNDLKADTAHVLEEMKEGNIRNVMITGDNIYTACSISKESRLSFAKQIIYGDIEIPFGSVIWRSFPNKEIVSPISLLQRVSDVHEIDLAITGAALNSLLRTPYENLARKDELLGNFVGVNGKADAMRFLLPYTRIFARMKPAQKVEVVKLHMERSITGMCGDGANDAAALRVAHCGVAVATGSSSATIVAPFSSSDASINVAAEVIRQGRGALASAFAGYKRLIMYGQMLLAIRIFLYHSSLQISEIAWIFIDSFINVGFSLTILLSKSSSKLTPTRPTSKLLGLEIFCSLGLQILVLLGMIFGSMGLLGRENWFACKNFDVSQANLGEWWTMGDNFEGAVLATIGTFQMINMGFVFNYGFEYRKWWFKNYGLLALWAIFFAIMCAVLFSPPNYLSCLFRINCGDASLLTRWDALKDIGFTNSLFTPFSDFFPNPFAPPGCPCKDTIAYSGYLDTCEQEYVSCRAPHYNQTFHHNYIPYRFRWILFGVVMVGFAVAILAEWAVVYGPIRRLLRKRKQRKRQALEKDVLTRLHASVQ
ncbi:haloacid dehalogenase family hydrolase domain-containing protein [Cardiosporidium cionae]|uniref:Haloacid dehalogenase family hydrolase domain-containing protein n=1 Tax=Cardiosporidium cionae TaxID=476202 RepID=A0ABQ7J7N3_9APIC|nr:haloacid dehalogenase family hydrolase domain-containing protein [Cardiosporidium cionae]|eukprot:KAF8819995.1 haloacid dehalogenase family hydrolase domain-containing protein [Cardiosporidium cionae]